MNTYLAPILSLVAITVAFVSSVYARKALEIARRDRGDKDRMWVVYLIQMLRVRAHGSTYVSCAVSVSNPSTLPDTASRTELRLHYRDRNDHIHTVIVEPEAQIVLPASAGPADRMVIPLNLAPGTSAQGWLTFRIPASIDAEMMVEKYELLFGCSRGSPISAFAYVLTEVVDK